MAPTAWRAWPPEDSSSQANVFRRSRRNASPTPQLIASCTYRRCAAGRTDSTKSKHRLNEIWTNKKVAEFGASKMTPSPFQSGQHDRWWQRKCTADQPTQVQGGCKDPTLAETPLGRKSLSLSRRVLLAYFRPHQPRFDVESETVYEVYTGVSAFTSPLSPLSLRNEHLLSENLPDRSTAVRLSQ
jgi:hypothetical protein